MKAGAGPTIVSPTSPRAAISPVSRCCTLSASWRQAASFAWEKVRRTNRLNGGLPSVRRYSISRL